MDDAEWLFKTDSREKKNVAQSARKKVRHTGCKLPSDYLSAKEKKKMNGEVFCMSIHKPMTYKYFKTLPKDLQQEYLDWLATTFGVSQKDICKEMLKVTPANLIKYIKTVGLRSPFSKNGFMNVPYDRDAWLKFLAGEEAVNAQNAPESRENDLCETNTGSDGTDNAVENAPQKALESCEKALHEAEDILNKKLLEKGYITENELREQLGLPKLEEEVRQYVKNDIRTLDEVVTEQPFEVGSLNFNLKNIRDWDALKECLSAFPLPAYNSVVITVHALREE